MKQDTTLRWLRFGSALTVFFGLLIAAAAIEIGAAPTQFLADLIFFPIDGAQDVAAPETRLIIVLLLGLPVALFLAWAFELTPEGVVKAEDLPSDTPKDPRAGRSLNIITIGYC